MLSAPRVGSASSGAASDGLARVRIGRCDRVQCILCRKLGNALEPDIFARIVGVRHDEAHIDSVREQHAQATRAHVMVCEHDGGACLAQIRLATLVCASGSRSSIASTV